MKKAAVFMTAVMLLFALVLMGSLPTSAEAVLFAGGSGIESDPYLIETKEHLDNVRRDLGAHYQLVADVVFTEEDFAEGGAFYNDGIGWDPLGNRYDGMFTGTFDGNGFAIVGLCANRVNHYAAPRVGVFGFNAGTITNLAVVGGSLVSTSYRGESRVGGIAAENRGTIARCYNSAALMTSQYGGGITGYNAGSITDCYNVGDVQTENRYETYGGGIAGGNSGTGRIVSCYNLGNVQGTWSGGLVGDNSGAVEYAYYAETEQRGCSVGSGWKESADVGVRCSAEALKTKATFAGFDFETVWDIDTEAAYPFPTLKTVLHAAEACPENTDEFAGGNGSFFAPYRIENATHLQNVRLYPDACFVLTNDVVFTAEDAQQWQSLGWAVYGGEWRAFTGIFDGDGYTICGLTTSLFHTNYGVVKNLAVGNATVTDRATVILDNHGTLSNCLGFSDLSVTIKDNLKIGGLVGANYGTIQNCFYQGDVNAGGSGYRVYVGGIAGSNESGIVAGNAGGTITRCYTVGMVISNETAGALVGLNEGTLQYVYAYERTPILVGEGVKQGTTATLTQLQSRAFFSGFDFNGVWAIDKATDYPAPTLRSVRTKGYVAPENTTEFAGGNGDLFHPFLITEKQHIDNIARHGTTYQHFKLASDVTYDETKSGAVIPSFNGILDGNTKTIRGLTITTTATKKQIGLIGQNTGVIKNLNLTDCTLTLTEAVESSVGTLVGANNGTLSGVNVETTIAVHNDSCLKKANIGGIAGVSNRLDTCSAAGTITVIGKDAAFNTNIGGVAGTTIGVLNNVVNKVNVTIDLQKTDASTRLNCGGLAGYSAGANVTTVRNEGDIRVDGVTSGIANHWLRLGGIIGEQGSGTVAFAANTGTVAVDTVTDDILDYLSVGGIIGECDGGGTVKQSVNNGNLNVVACYGDLLVGGIAGATNGTLADCYNTGNVVSEEVLSQDNSAFAVGILGYARPKGSVSRCYNVGSLTGGRVAGITGYAYDSTYQHNYYLNNVNRGAANGSSSNMYARTAEQLTATAQLSGFNFYAVWEINAVDGYHYPTLRNVPHVTAEHVCEATLSNPSSDAQSHWERCDVCGAKIAQESHVFDFDCDNKCNVCFYVRQADHMTGGLWTTSETKHWQVCSICNQSLNSGMHRYDNDCDVDCNVCKAERVTEHVYRTAWDATCDVCEETRAVTYTGWAQEGDNWYYYQNGTLLTNTWQLDSVGWCYLGSDGAMKTNAWIQDSVGWCYVGANGYIVKSNWVNDGGKWYYLNKDGYMLKNTWQLDSIGWCYLGADGAMKTNSWIKDSVGWCYVGADGYCVTNNWVKDSVGWVYLNADGRMVTNAWVKDSVGWCYVGSDGYAVTECWKKDSIGWCYLNENGSMTKSDWVYDGGWYYLDANGYMVTGTRTIQGINYTFKANGLLVE